MTYYRLYFLNAVSGHIDRFEEYDAADDAAAIEMAERHCGAAPLELWSGRRKVRHLAGLGSPGRRPLGPWPGSREAPAA